MISLTTFLKFKLTIRTLPDDVPTSRFESCLKLTIDVIFSLLEGAKSLDLQKI